MRVQRTTYRVPVPRAVLVAAGILTPTPEEQADMERKAAEARRWQAERDEKRTAAQDRLAAITDPLARTVLDLHAENDRHECEGCDFEGYEAEHPEWPCRTVHAVAEHFGIQLP